MDKPVLELLRPILVTLQVSGCLPPTLAHQAGLPLSGHRCWYRIWYCLLFIFYHIYVIHILVWCIGMRSDSRKLVTEWIELIRTLIAICNMDILLYNQNALTQCIRSLVDAYPATSKTARNKTYKRVRVLSVVFWFYSIVGANFGILKISFSNSYGGYLNGNVYGLDSETSSPSTYVAIVADLFFKCFIFLNNLSFTMLLHSELAFEFRYKFEHLGLMLTSKLRVISAGDLRRFRHLHGRLTLLLRNLDDVLSPMVLFWYGAYFVSICSIVTTIVRNQAEFLAYCQILYIILNFSLLTWSFSAMSDAIDAPLRDVYRITNSHDPSEWTIYNQAHLLSIQLSSVTGFTAWKFFTVNRGSSLTACGALLSYVVLVIQMNPTSLTYAAQAATEYPIETVNATTTNEL